MNKNVKSSVILLFALIFVFTSFPISPKQAEFTSTAYAQTEEQLRIEVTVAPSPIIDIEGGVIKVFVHFNGIPIQGASVSINSSIEGDYAGFEDGDPSTPLSQHTVVTTDWAGSVVVVWSMTICLLEELPVTLTFQASKDGYVSVTDTITVSAVPFSGINFPPQGEETIYYDVGSLHKTYVSAAPKLGSIEKGDIVNLVFQVGREIYNEGSYFDAWNIPVIKGDGGVVLSIPKVNGVPIAYVIEESIKTEAYHPFFGDDWVPINSFEDFGELKYYLDCVNESDLDILDIVDWPSFFRVLVGAIPDLIEFFASAEYGVGDFYEVVGFNPLNELVSLDPTLWSLREMGVESVRVTIPIKFDVEGTHEIGWFTHWQYYTHNQYVENNAGAMSQMQFTVTPPTPVAVDVALIIDSSGSMTSSDPSNLRKEAAKVFVDSMQDEDQVAIVDFDSYTRIAFPLNTVGDNRTAIKAAIDTINSSGGTNIGAGLLAGYNQLLSSTKDYRKAAVLMTDGMGTYYNQAAYYVEKGWPVYTIGLGPYTDEALLKRIAEETGGQYFKLDSAAQLASVYFEIATTITQGEIINYLNNYMFPLTWWEVEQPVPPDINSVFFFVNWGHSEVSTSLVSPDGTIIDPSTVDPNIYHAKGLTYELYRVDYPIPGNWLVKMYGTDLPLEGEEVTLQVSVVREMVSNQPPTISPPGDQNVQSSDLLNFQVAATDPDDPVSSLIFNSDSLPDGISLTDNGDGTATISGTITDSPGIYNIEISVSDPGGLSDTIIVPLTITQEDARTTYTGPMLVSTGCADCTTATVPLRATIQDITAVMGDPAYDPDPGNITNATVTFVNRETDASLCSTSVILLDPADTKVGTAACDWLVDIGNSDGLDYTVGIIVDGYYTRNSAEDDALVVVSKPTSYFITGGGYLINQDSAGIYAGDPEMKTNFGINVKFDNKLKNLKGRATIIVRNGESVYQIKSNALASLAVVPYDPADPKSGVAELISKANITDVTDPLYPIEILGNATLQIKMLDTGEPGDSDMISITLWGSDGSLLFSSNWNGVQTIEQLLDGGNLQVH